MARSLLGRSKPLVDATTKSGEADLTHISALIDMELQVLDTQDSIYRRALDSKGATPALSRSALKRGDGARLSRGY